MLEDLAYLAVPRNVRGDNPSSAENQQERLVDSRSESSETMRQTSRSRDEDMVPTAWRHAGMVIKEKPSACLDQASKTKSEIPCRASSDPHEWRNELGAVSDRYSAKLQYL